MTSQIQKTALKIMLGVCLIAFTLVACNNKGGNKKDDKPQDTAKVEAPPVAPPKDTTQPEDTSVMDTRPVKPGE
jgi:hypothetical protein